MRIAVIAPPWAPVPPQLYGGIELIVDRLARGYQTAGHEVLLFTTGDSTSAVPMAWALPRSEGNRIGSAVVELRHVMHAYEAVAGFDIVHDHTVMGPVYAELFPDLRVVTTIHGLGNDPAAEAYDSSKGMIYVVNQGNSYSGQYGNTVSVIADSNNPAMILMLTAATAVVRRVEGLAQWGGCRPGRPPSFRSGTRQGAGITRAARRVRVRRAARR